MCSHDDCRVEVLPDGTANEVHVFSIDQMEEIQEVVNRWAWKLNIIEKYGVIPEEVVFGGKSGTSP